MSYIHSYRIGRVFILTLGSVRGECEVVIDIQSEKSGSQFAISRCGVQNVRYPVVIVDEVTGCQQQVAATWRLGVGVPADQRGTHMSRFLELVENQRQSPMSLDGQVDLARTAVKRLEATDVEIETSFTWFREVEAPVSHLKSQLEMDVTFLSKLNSDGNTGEKVIRLGVMAKALCPCSKAISEYGAHNQRSRIEASIHMSLDAKTPSLAKLAECLESGASSPVYPLLKRQDEKFVTEQAYNNPTFVEDIVRRIAERLYDLPIAEKFVVEAVNHESIHAHDCFARVEFVRSK